MNIINTLSLWQWVIIGLVPPAIVALYFLKLKRQPLEVPSTYLWSRTIEDLHVNSIWQRLRQSLLLLLQLLLLALLILACLRPGWQGAQLIGDRFIFLIDNSASMSATDIEPSRLEAAKEQVLGLIDQMKTDDVAMVICFSDAPDIVQSFTDNRSLLRQSVNRIQPTCRTSDLRGALRVAAGRANPGRTSDAESATDIPVADAVPATLYLYTDGGFAAVPDFSLGNLEPIYVPVGSELPENLAVAAFSAERNTEKPDQMQAFARVENTGADDVSLYVSLFELDDAGKESLLDAKSVAVKAGKTAGVDFDLIGIEQRSLKLKLDHQDQLDLDNAAFAAVTPPRPARVLLVTAGNEVLQLALDTSGVRSLANVIVVDPTIWETKPQQDLAAAGYYDVVIFDRYAPKEMPQSNTLFIGLAPPVEGWSQGAAQIQPIVIDTDRVHPITQYVELGNAGIFEGHALTTPAGGATLIDSDVGSLCSIAPRGGFEDAALGFALLSENEKGEMIVNSDWISRRTFPVFVMNAVRYLGGVTDTASGATVRPGLPIQLRTEAPIDRIIVKTPRGKRAEVMRDSQNRFVYTATDQLGVYDVYEGSSRTASQQFAVNLFDSQESDLRPRPEIKLQYQAVQATGGLEPTRKEGWKWILIIGLLVLIFEWYVYNRRVYL